MVQSRTHIHWIMRHRWTSLALALLAMMAQSAIASAGPPPDGLVAVVNGKELKQIHFERVMDQVLPRASFHGNVTPEVMAENIKKSMDKMIDEELLCQEAERLGLKAEKKLVAKELKDTVKRVGGEDKFREALKHYGISRKDFERIIAKPLMVKQVLELAESKAPEVTVKEAREYYERNKEGHFKVNRRRFKHIVIKTDPGDPSTWEAAHKKAEQVVAKLKGGGSFDALAREYSDGPRKETGGDTGLVDRSQIMPELAKAGWQLKLGEVSSTIQTIYGYHILKLVESPPPAALPFEEAREQIVGTINGMRKQQAKDDFLKRLKAKARIKVLVNE